MTADGDAGGKKVKKKKTTDTEVHTISVSSRKHQAVQKGGGMRLREWGVEGRVERAEGCVGHSSAERDQRQSPDSNVKLE